MGKNEVPLRFLPLVFAAGFLVACVSSPPALEAKYAAFRAQDKAVHEAAASGFSQRDLQVGTVRWHFVEAGDPSGPTVLMLHRLPESWYSWARVIPLLDPGFHYIVPDMKGYGQSTATDTDYSWHTVARQTLDLMDALQVDTFFIVGHDWGALIASVIVSDHPERIRGFVRMEADVKYRPGQSLDKLYAQKPQWKLFQDTARAVALLRDAGPFIDMVYPPRMKTPFRKADRDYFVYEFSRPGVAEAIANYFKYESWDLEAAVTKIATNRFPFPVLQLQADGDPSQPVSSFADVPALFPNVRLEWITNAGHFDNLDQPTQVAEAINRFLASR
jgi:pimeloyl-ACP methyl ester carboxylesterase